MERNNQPQWPMSWRERMDRMQVGEHIDVDEKVVKSVRYIASKHFNSPKANSEKRFTTKRCGNNVPPKFKLWRKEDVKKGGQNVRDN